MCASDAVKDDETDSSFAAKVVNILLYDIFSFFVCVTLFHFVLFC